MVHLFRPEDVKVITEKISEIMDVANKRARDTYEPTYKEYLTVFSIISNYIKKNRRIVYGGIALNEMLKEKKPEDVIYKEYSFNDIEIYSYDPVSDVKNLCNMLYEKKYKYIEGKEADHPGTFTIFVNFEKYCDITYVPKIIYNNMNTISVNGYTIIHPLYIIIDSIRVYSDPMTSYRRLDRTFERTNKLLSVSSFAALPGIIKENSKHEHIIQELLPKINTIPNSIITDDIAYNYYIQQETKKESGISHLGIMISNFDKDANKIYNILMDIIAKKDIHFKEHVKIEEYNPFFQYWSNRIIIYYHDEPIVTMYKHTKKCLQYQEIEKYGTKIKIANFTGTLLNYLFQYNYLAVFKKSYLTVENKIGNLLQAKNAYLSKHKSTVLDDTPFREFQIECLGNTIDSKRAHYLLIQKRLDKSLPVVYRYKPESENNSLSEEYRFPNEAGTLIINDKNKIIQI
jgi:hypothetical protein